MIFLRSKMAATSSKEVFFCRDYGARRSHFSMGEVKPEHLQANRMVPSLSVSLCLLKRPLTPSQTHLRWLLRSQ